MLNEKEIGKIFWNFEKRIKQLMSGKNIKVLSVYDCCRKALKGEREVAEKALKSHNAAS